MSGSNPQPWHAVSIEQIANILTGLGYRAEVMAGLDKPRVISSTAAGWSFFIAFYPIGDGQAPYTRLRFFSFFPDMGVSVDDCNRWNAEERFINAAIGSDGVALAQWDVLLKGGSARLFKECLRHWKRCLGSFAATVGNAK